MAIEYPLRVLKKAVDISSGKKVLREVETLHKLPVEVGNIDAFCKYMYNHYGHGTFVVKDRLDKPVLHALVFSGSYKLLHGKLKDELKALEEGEGLAQGNERVSAAQQRASPDIELPEVKGPIFENRLIEEMHAGMREIKKSLKEQEDLGYRLQALENNLKGVEDKISENLKRVKKIDEGVASELSAIRHSLVDKMLEVRTSLERFPVETFKGISSKLENEEKILEKLQEISESGQIKRLERRLALQEEWIERRIASEFDRVMGQLEENRKTLETTVEKEAKTAMKKLRKAESKAKREVGRRAKVEAAKAKKAAEKEVKKLEKVAVKVAKEKARAIKKAVNKAKPAVKKAMKRSKAAEKEVKKLEKVAVKTAKRAAERAAESQAVKEATKAIEARAPRAVKVIKAARRWSATEIDYLKAQFPTTQTKVLAAYLNKSTASVLHKANQLGLKRVEPAAKKAVKKVKRAAKKMAKAVKKEAVKTAKRAAKKLAESPAVKKAAKTETGKKAEKLAKEVIAEVKKAGKEAEAKIKREKKKAVKAVKKAKPKSAAKLKKPAEKKANTKPKKAKPKSAAKLKKSAKKKTTKAKPKTAKK